jgi:uncharacterized protein involved in exopolysaccharide biosynthesis
MTGAEKSLPESPRPPDEDLATILAKIWRRRFLAASLTLGAMVTTGAGSYLIAPTYSASSTLMPAESGNDVMSAALASLGNLGGLAAQAGMGLKGSLADRFVIILRSRSVALNIHANPELRRIVFHEFWDETKGIWKQPGRRPPEATEDFPSRHDALRKLSKMVRIVSDPKTGLVTISADARTPEGAARLANAYVDELLQFLQQNSFSKARRDRIFLTKKLAENSRDLAKVEQSLRVFMEQNRLVSLEAQTQATVQSYATLKGELLSREMRLKLMQGSVGPDDLQMKGLEEEVVELRNKLSTLEASGSGGLVSFAAAPELGMRLARLKRDVLVKQKVFEVLTQQLELARIQEAKETLAFQVIDTAMAPDERSKPRRTAMVLLAGLLAGFASACLAYWLESRAPNASGTA